MRRREFITLLGGAAAWPLAARAQQGDRLPRIGIIDDGPMWDHFRHRLRELGYIEGQTVTIDYRSAEEKPDRLAAVASELARLPVDVIVAFGTAAAHAAKEATTTIPIVMMVGEPVRSGLVANFARPGGNITGYTVLGPEIAAKRLHPLFSGIQKTRPMPPMNGSISKARAAPEGRGFSCAPQAASCALSQSLPRFLRLRPHRAEWRRHAARSARGPQGHAYIIDGEAVACDDNGVASFDLIRLRGTIQRWISLRVTLGAPRATD